MDPSAFESDRESGDDASSRFNLSAWAIAHRSLALFFVIALALAGVFAYMKLGRAEDPNFTIKVANINAAWPGATASEMQDQVADTIEKKLQELPYLDRARDLSRAGRSWPSSLLPRRHAARRR